MYYEVCLLEDVKKAHSGPYYLLDAAIDAVKSQSKQTSNTCVVVLIERDNYGISKRSIRAFSVDGKFDWAAQCKACQGKGYTETESYNGFWTVHEIKGCKPCLGVGCVAEQGLTLRPPAYF